MFFSFSFVPPGPDSCYPYGVGTLRSTLVRSLSRFFWDMVRRWGRAEVEKNSGEERVGCLVVGLDCWSIDTWKTRRDVEMRLRLGWNEERPIQSWRLLDSWTLALDLPQTELQGSRFVLCTKARTWNFELQTPHANVTCCRQNQNPHPWNPCSILAILGNKSLESLSPCC